MSFIVLIMIIVCAGIPACFVWRVFRLDQPSLVDWLVPVAEASVLVALVMILGRWDMAGYSLRFALVVIFAVALLWSLGRHLFRPWIAREVWRRQWVTAVSLTILGGALGYVVTYGMLPQADARDLAFPLKGGRFVVGQGGGIGVLNHHADHGEQRHAADITAIGVLGYRAAGLAPAELDRYVIHGAEVVSPCVGEVVAARGDLPDLTPPKADRENARGNHVVIDCGDFHVELAHLQQGSIGVAPGQMLQAGDAIGKVGNSGNTTEPHLHIHAVDSESRQGIPIAFGGRAPLRNRLFEN